MLEETELNNINDQSINNYIFPEYEEKQIKEAFDIFDLNGNNFISVVELKEIFNYLSEDVTEEELDEMINLVDKEGNGQVNWLDFYEFINGKIINDETKEIKRTKIIPEQHHLKESKIEFINLEKNNDINNYNNKYGEESIKSPTNKKTQKIRKEKNLINFNELNDQNENSDEDIKIDNYVQEILKKRQQRLENNYLVNKAKINNIEDKNVIKSRKMILNEENNNLNNKIITYDSFSESSIENENESNNNIIDNSKNSEDEKSKSKTSNFLSINKTNSLKKIEPLLNDIKNINNDIDNIKKDDNYKDNNNIFLPIDKKEIKQLKVDKIKKGKKKKKKKQYNNIEKEKENE